MVPLHKPYERLIVLGKETKPVEFGMKVNKLEVDDISFIERARFDNFNKRPALKMEFFAQKII